MSFAPSEAAAVHPVSGLEAHPIHPVIWTGGSSYTSSYILFQWEKIDISLYLSHQTIRYPIKYQDIWEYIPQKHPIKYRNNCCKISKIYLRTRPKIVLLGTCHTGLVSHLQLSQEGVDRGLGRKNQGTAVLAKEPWVIQMTCEMVGLRIEDFPWVEDSILYGPFFLLQTGHCQTLSDSSNSGNQWKSHDGLNLCQVLCSQTKACKAQVPFKAWGSGCLLERWWVFLSEWHQKWHQKWKKSGNLPGLVYTQNQLSHPQTTNSMRICLPTHGEIA